MASEIRVRIKPCYDKTPRPQPLSPEYRGEGSYDIGHGYKRAEFIVS
jgi:hypothetical protein